ncbi:Wzz/FepE/Etk N-terminal domain-containing protein [Micromonospora sp. DR5-3]|uniref:Wzz/FepE/Etk N-terminal domain-containing protein n=1 Tax=unclassified Micromonospora TaxID=2617518 RepID=UPI0011D7FBF4|nr:MULTISPECIES: Wzz/FepE/Etk N-terminal domain-containing protein [unclassified Micromonospora]MCW3816505.1 Wzz/FepE/Etk N-terminal domain-containing protein [Micromonospora sp. DR5-3]TYC23077.1 lipopolysaccharide biosynthesis protein [Micromonospora sp. MP36]
MPSPHLAESDSDGLALMAYLGWLRRRWWILLLAALLGTAGGLAVSQLQHARYTSSTSLLVRPLSTGGESNPNAKVNLDTEAQVVRSLVVAERAKGLMKSSTPADELVQSVAVNVPPNSQVLQVAYEADSPAQAQAGSHAFAQAYLDLRKATAQKTVENETAALKQQIGDVNKQLSAVAGRIAAAPSNSVERQRAEADRSVLTNQLAALNNRLSPLLSADTDPGEIISDARLPQSPSSPNRTLNLASGMGAGLLLGIVLALVLDRLDTRVRRGRDISDRVGLPLLLELPARASSLTMLPAGHQISRELGRLRNVLLSAVPEPRGGGRGRQLLLCDGSAGTAAGFVAANLAAAYARTGQQVALVTTKPDSALSSITGVAEGRHNLASVLRRDVPALKALAPVPGLGQLRVLVPGDLDAEIELPVAGLLEILGELSARFDHVLIETAQPTVAVEAQALGRYVDAVIVVAESGRTRSGEITAALQQFEQVNAPVIGAVLAPRLPVPAGGTSRPAAPANRPKPRPTPGPSAESTMVLPRMRPTDPGSAAGTAKPPAASKPVPVNGNSGTYRSRGDSPSTDGPGRGYALERGEDLG